MPHVLHPQLKILPIPTIPNSKKALKMHPQLPMSTLGGSRKKAAKVASTSGGGKKLQRTEKTKKGDY